MTLKESTSFQKVIKVPSILVCKPMCTGVQCLHNQLYSTLRLPAVTSSLICVSQCPLYVYFTPKYL